MKEEIKELKAKLAEIEKKHKKASSFISTVIKSCEEGLDGSWDCSTEEGREGFEAMAELLELAKDELK